MTGQSAPSLWLHGVTTLAFIIHIGGGIIGLVSGTVAVFARKGGYLHRKAGTVFVVAMLIMACFAGYLAVAVPDQIVNLFISTFTVYLLATAWITVRRREGATGLFEKIALFVAVCLCAPLRSLAIQLAAGLTPMFKECCSLQVSSHDRDLCVHVRAGPRGDR